MSSSPSADDDENILLGQILKICLDDFISDFVLEDVPYISYNGLVFTEDEMSKFRTLPEGEQQVCYMFFLLTEKNKNIKLFLEVLGHDYKWLKDKVYATVNAYNEGNKNILNYINTAHELQINFPKHADFNIYRLNYFCTIRRRLKSLKPRHYLVIYGELGYGKKWLALHACCDYSVINAMNYKIFWLDVHDCDSPERDLEKLQRFKILLGESSSQKKIGDYEGLSNKILELQQELRSILKDDEFKDCLLVLSDVQNRKTVEAFSLPCKILITTRNKKISDSLSNVQSNTVHVKTGLTSAECIDLFEKVLNVKSSKFPENCNDLFDQIKGHPFLLNIIAQNLKNGSKEEWNKWIKYLENFQIANNNKINNLITFSFNVLREDEFSLYKTLCIFHHSVKIPVKILAKLWDKKEKDAEELIRKFDKFSLVNITPLRDDTMACTIHFLYYSYLKSCIVDDKVGLHRKLVESYNIEEALRKRTELDIIDLPNDNYFHYYIGYHLKEAMMTEFFAKLYLDFGFLGQKLRATGLPNTIGDLKHYRKEITGGDPYKEKLIDSLLQFLPNIEEMIFKSNDTCLLQYALMADGFLKTEAENQARMFRDKIWFSDGDHFHRRRQMIKLPDKPKVIKLIDPDTCLIALDNHIMLLADLSLGYNIEPTKFVGHHDNVTSISMFHKNYLLSLDKKGVLRVWSIADERRRSIIRKESSRLIVNHINFENSKMREKECLQIIERNQDGQKQIIQCYYLEVSEDKSVHLHLVFADKNISIYKWNDDAKKFLVEKIPSLKTNVPNVRFALKLFDKYLVLNDSGSLTVYNLRDGSTGLFSFEWPKNLNSPVNMHCFTKGAETFIVFVFLQKILLISLPSIQKFVFLTGQIKELYRSDDPRSAITCSALTEDNKYLVIGTKQGIMVYDICEKSEVLRNSISEVISCVDVYSLDDDIYKYVIVSGSEGCKALNIFGLKVNGNNSITWANSIGNLADEDNSVLQFEPNAWLLGKKLFDVSFDNDSISLVAVDSKNRIHQFLHKWSMILPDEYSSKITAITAINDKYYYGCESGDIFDSTDYLIMNFNNPITFLRLITENLLVASSASNSIIYNNDKIYNFDISVEECYHFDKYLIMLERNCKFFVVDTENNFSIVYQIADLHDLKLGGSDFKANYLALATKIKNIFIYKFVMENEELQRPKLHCYTSDNPTIITCFALSVNATIGAVGYHNGLIEIRKIDKSFRLLQKLESHKSQIFGLKFSPWTETPLILASISEQICFWDIAYILNNPLDHINGIQRHSSRFNSAGRLRSDNHTPVTSPTNIKLSNHLHNPWINKKGPSDKQELLACIKFAGNRTEKFYTNQNFTKFVTIDDEGEYYPLSVNNISMSHTNGTTYNDDSAIKDDVII